MRVMMGGQTASAPIDVINDTLPWHALYYTGGPEFVALGYTNGVDVTNFPDEIGTVNMSSMLTDWPTFVASDADFGGEPSIDFNGGQAIRTTTTGITGPSTVILIGKYKSTSSPSTTAYLCDHDTSGGRFIFFITSSTGFRFSSTTTQVLAGGTKDTNPHCWVGYGNDNSSEWVIDGTSVATGDTDAIDWGGVRLGTNFNNSFFAECRIVLYGVMAGEATVDAGYANFNQWVEDTYGLTIA